MVVRYALPDHWLRYDLGQIASALIEAKAAVLALISLPFQKAWAEQLQEIELKREVAGTSRIEGADFTERELDEAVSPNAPPDQFTRSQKQARAAMLTYRWIASLAIDRPVTGDLIRDIHRRIVTGCDDDHCPPGLLRGADQKVTFGRPRHRGAGGGGECETAFAGLMGALGREYPRHDPLIQALALHYHIGAIHPFHDGNGRTARAVEALFLQRAGLKDALFIAMSNYYYDEKDAYLRILSEVGTNGHDMTAFIRFGLTGIALQCRRLLREIKRHLSISLYRDVMGQMYGRLTSTKKRALAKRQVAILEELLKRDAPCNLDELIKNVYSVYAGLKVVGRAFYRDMDDLEELKAITIQYRKSVLFVAVRLEWATEITETEFFKRISALPSAKTRLLRG